MDRAFHWRYIAALCISVFTSMLLLVNPALSQRLIDDVIVAQNPDPLLGILAVMLAVKLGREGLRYLIRECGIEPAAAINACTINPARLLNIDETYGLIRTGYNADLTILDDDYQVVQTYCRGTAQL